MNGSNKLLLSFTKLYSRKSVFLELKLAFYLSLPIVVFNLIAIYTNIKPPYINIDFIIIGFFLVFNNTLIRVIFLITTLLVSFYAQSNEIAGAIYYFDIYQSLRFLSYVNNWPLSSLLIPVSCAIVLIIALTIILIKTGKSVTNPIFFPMIFTTLLFTDIFFGTNIIKFTDTRSHANFVTSPTFAVLKAMHDLSTTEPGTAVKSETSPASHELLSKILNEEAGNTFVLSIGFESLGLPIGADENKLLVEIFKRAFYQHELVNYLAEKFNGGTLNGELRGLCGINISPLLLDLSDENISDCIPKLASDASWETYAVHGNTGAFYNRSNVYPRLGFKNSFFYRELKNNGATVCNDAFSGICDGSAIASAIGTIEKSSSKKFIHFMSLETHFPLPAISENPHNNCIYIENRYYNKVCDSVNAIAKSVYSSGIMPDQIVIFGDHPPPFISGRSRNLFSKNEVPVFHFVIK